MTLDAPPPPASTMRRDLLSAYVASGAKVTSWALATLLLVQFRGAEEFALFALIRGTLSFLNYTTLGLAPAIIHALTQVTPLTLDLDDPSLLEDSALGDDAGHPAEPAAGDEQPPFARVLSYQRREEYHPERDPEFRAKQVGYSSILLAIVLGIIACALAASYAIHVVSLHGITVDRSMAGEIAWFLGIGISLRLASDACGALLQAFGHITTDNIGLTVAEGTWIILMLLMAATGLDAASLAGAFLLSSLILLAYRAIAVPAALGPSRPRLMYFDLSIAGSLLVFGMLVSIAQLADFLYAPTDFLLINHLIGLTTVAVYAPAVQIDAGLLLVVGGLATVLLPKAAIAHAAGNVTLLRQYFLRGTLASAGMLLVAAVAVYFASPMIFHVWLHNPMPATQAILPLILIHTVVGGSSAVGRSILLGMGKVKPFTIAVLIAGVSNVVLSYSFVRFGGLGLNGIVLGTICAVLGRCAIWQPWYVWRCLCPTPSPIRG